MFVNSQDIYIEFVCSQQATSSLRQKVDKISHKQLVQLNKEINPYFILPMQPHENQNQQIQSESEVETQSQGNDLDIKTYAVQNQSTKISFPQQILNKNQSQKPSTKQSRRKNFYIIFVRKLAKIINKFLMHLSFQQKNLIQNKYLQFYLNEKKQTLKSLKDFLMNGGQINQKFDDYLQNDGYFVDIDQCRSYLRKFIYKIKEEIKDQAQKKDLKEIALFREQAQEFIADLQNNKMRGKAPKISKKR